jgi:hypothetical protein
MADTDRALSPVVTRRAVVGGAAALIAFGGRLADVLAQATPVAGGSAMGYPELTVTVTDAELQVSPESVPAGLVLLTVVNQTQSEVGAAVIQPAEGYTMQDLQNAAATPPASPDEFPAFFYTEAHIVGGPGSPPAGGTAQAVIEVAEGDAVVFAEGNQPPAFITVTAASGAAAEPPATSVTIVEVDFAFGGVANAAPAGQQVWEVRNEGTQPHMLVLGKVPDGTTWDQVYGAATSDPSATPEPGALGQEDFQYVGGVLLQSGGTTVYPMLDLEAGTYALMCFVSDPNHGNIPHVMEGMIAVLEVS